MRKAARIALVIGGGAVMVLALATPGAQAERSRVTNIDAPGMTTARQQPRQQERPDRMAFLQASGVINVATAIARFPGAPEVAGHKQGTGRAEIEFAALPTTADTAKNRSAWSDALDFDTATSSVPADNQRMASGQTGVALISAARKEQQSERTPVIVEFKGIVINFN